MHLVSTTFTGAAVERVAPSSKVIRLSAHAAVARIDDHADER